MEWLYEDRETEESMGLAKPRKESGKRLSKEMVHTSSFFFFTINHRNANNVFIKRLLDSRQVILSSCRLTTNSMRNPQLGNEETEGKEHTLVM
jgi:hypothetical protein